MELATGEEETFEHWCKCSNCHVFCEEEKVIDDVKFPPCTKRGNTTKILTHTHFIQITRVGFLMSLRGSFECLLKETNPHNRVFQEFTPAPLWSIRISRAPPRSGTLKVEGGIPRETVGCLGFGNRFEGINLKSASKVNDRQTVDPTGQTFGLRTRPDCTLLVYD